MNYSRVSESRRELVGKLLGYARRREALPKASMILSLDLDFNGHQSRSARVMRELCVFVDGR